VGPGDKKDKEGQYEFRGQVGMNSWVKEKEHHETGGGVVRGWVRKDQEAGEKKESGKVGQSKKVTWRGGEKGGW